MMSNLSLPSISDRPLASPPLVAAGQIRLLVLDLDGTTVGQSNQVRPAVQQAVQAAQAQGVQVAIATGRMFCSALRFHRDLGSTLPLMAYQGALIQEPQSGQIHRHWTVPQSMARQLLDHFEQPELRPHLSIHFYLNDCLYIREMSRESEEYAERTGIKPVVAGDLRQLLSDPSVEPTKVLALSQDIDLIDSLWTGLRQQYTPAELYLTKSVATFFEATHPLVNKGTAVQYLAEELLGLQPEQVMAIGDNFNDLEMLHYAGIGVAMANGPEAVKAVADWVAPDVEQDGVAAAIEQFVLTAG